MKYEDLRRLIKKNDFVEIKTKFQNNLNKCLIVGMSKDILKIALILEDGEVAAVSPIMAIPYDILLEVNKIKPHNLLFYSNLNNSHLEGAIVSKINNKRSNAKI
jgi:transcriptional regulator of heat shock response